MARSASSAKGSTILAYFSHSYREEDHEVNSFFWRLFHDEGFFFTVDPKSDFFSISYLESMMTLSNCFVAVITKRAGAPAGCSPYILFEYGLAVEAQKPWLVFVEQGLSGESFPNDPERVLPFNRQRLNEDKDEFSASIKKLAGKVRGYRNPDRRLKRPAGLVIAAGEEAERVYTPQLIQSLKTEMAKYGRQLKTVAPDFGASFEFCLELDQYDFLVMETHESLQAPWLAGYVLGRAISSIKVFHLGVTETPDSVTLPPIIARHKPEHTAENPVIYWRDERELVQGVMKHVAKFNTERIEFHRKTDGLRYFRRAGRREAKVFISNASVSNPLAQKVIARLRLESIDFFHYHVKDAIRIGDAWLAELEEQIEHSGIFVALLTEEYLQSQWCLYELQVARKRVAEGKLRIHPYVLSKDLFGQLSFLGITERQARDLSGSEQRAIVADVVDNVDRELKQKTPEAVSPAPAVSDRAKTVPAPELSLTEEERAKLLDMLTARLTTEDDRPAWIKVLLIHAMLYDQLAGEDYAGSAAAAASALVTKVEALGVLPNGQRAVLLLVRTVHDRQLVSQEYAPFLTQLVERLEADTATA